MPNEKEEKKQMKTKTYNVYADPSHAWVKVKIAELDKLGISKYITSFSYVRGDHAYLEEDCDAGVFLSALKERGIEPKFKFHHTDNRSKIRGYASFPARSI